MPQRIVRRTVTEVEKTRKPETYAYLRYDISFAFSAKETEIPQRVLSRAINRQCVIEEGRRRLHGLRKREDDSDKLPSSFKSAKLKITLTDAESVFLI